MNKYVSGITVVSLLAIILLAMDKISLEMFLIIFLPLGIIMLFVGGIELKNTLKDKKSIEAKAEELKNRKR
ncbi:MULTISPECIES: hypothetical protein [Bacillaceae]|uniref:hypothetical protein n=1 Tax=Bacillaceae TaxID=186817 RepID=UPI000E742EAB|nr:hypothetical protein [Bacillus sp. PK3_68]RJS60520.1 hypothetical protein CJ483_10920 [Bacillus sp. PK3_68]